MAFGAPIIDIQGGLQWSQTSDQESKFANENLPRLPTPVYLAQKVGRGMG